MKLAQSHRSIIAQFVIAVSLCGALYYFVVEPAKFRLAATREKILSLLSETGQAPVAGQLTKAQIDRIHSEIAARAALIDKNSAPARSEASLFAKVSEFAQAHSVRLDQLQPLGTIRSRPPGSPAQSRPDTPAAIAAASAKTANEVAIGYSISVRGTYTDVSAFIDELSHNMGFTLVTGFKITLAGEANPDEVRADITTDHFAFDTRSLATATAPEAKP